MVIPLGGAVGRQHKTLIDNRIKRIVLDNDAVAVKNQLELASACAKIIASGVLIDYEMFPALVPCQAIKVVQKTPSLLPITPVAPPVQKLVPPVRVLVPPVEKPESPKQKEPINSRPRKGIRALW